MECDKIDLPTERGREGSETEIEIKRKKKKRGRDR